MNMSRLLDDTMTDARQVRRLRAAVIILLAVVCLLGGLLIGGAFSGGRRDVTYTLKLDLPLKPARAQVEAIPAMAMAHAQEE